MYSDILVPVDSNGTDVSDVIDQALFLAQTCDATVHVLHVVDERAYSSIPTDARDKVRDALEEDGEDVTKSVAQQAVENDTDVVREIRWGDPTVGILAYAKEYDVDLIVMGTHARTGYERFLLGSVTEKVVRASPIPVLTTRIGDEDDMEQTAFEIDGERIV